MLISNGPYCFSFQVPRHEEFKELKHVDCDGTSSFFDTGVTLCDVSILEVCLALPCYFFQKLPIDFYCSVVLFGASPNGGTLLMLIMIMVTM